MGFSNLSKNNVIFFVVISTFLILMNAGCTRKIEGVSTLTITIPSDFNLSKISSTTPAKLPHESVSINSEPNEGGMDWNVMLNPTPLDNSSLSQFNCYMIAISGDEPDMKRNICTTSTGSTFYIGRWVGGIAFGNPMSIEVPSGPKRNIMVFGLKTTAGSCVNFRTANMDGSNLSEPFLLASVTQDLNAGNNVVSIARNLTATTAKLADCDGPDFNDGGGQAMYFGSATTGNTAVGSSTNITSLGGAYSRINSVVVSDPSKTSFSVDSTTDFNVNDEVMLIVMGSKGTELGPNNNDYSSCGYRGWNGVYQFGKILSKSGGVLDINKGTFIDYLHKDADSDLTTYEADDLALVNTRLSNAPTLPEFCYIQVVKVPHFYDLTLSSVGTLSPPAFDYSSNAGGGVLAFRVSNNLTFGGPSSQIFATGLGYQGSASQNGEGYMGKETTCTTNANTGSGGGCGTSPAMAGAGGGHGNQPAYPTYGPFGPSGGDGVGTWAGYGAGEDCGGPNSSDYCFGNLTHKIFMGGAGGGNNNVASPGGHGGGIIYIAAKNIISSAGGYIKSNGTFQLADYNSGGGAGGSILLSYKTIDSTTSLGLTTMGGKGTDGPVSTVGGGGGGGGRQHIISCKNNGVSSAVTTGNVNPGAPGAAATTGFAGLLGFKAQYDVDCPN